MVGEAGNRRAQPCSVLHVFAIVGIVLGVGSSGAAAQQADPFKGVEEMLVTGYEAPIDPGEDSTATIGFDAEDLSAFQIENVSDLGAYIPNVEIRSPDPTSASFFVRGVGLQDYSPNASSSVPVFQDGIPRNPSAAQLPGLFDIAKVDVLKGPRGSGNYRNASAGVIRVSTVKPENNFGGFAKIKVSKLVSVDARDAHRYEAEAAINVPILLDLLSARFSIRFEHENPFFENGCANRVAFADRQIGLGFGQAPDSDLCGELVRRNRVSAVTPFLPRFIGESDDFAFRGQLRFHPEGHPVDWLLRVELTRLSRDSPVGQHIGTARGLGGQDTAVYQDPDNTARQAELEAEIRAANPGIRRRDLRRLALARLGRELLDRPLDQHPYRGDFDRPGRTFLETHLVSTTGRIHAGDVDIEINAGFLDYRRAQSIDFDLSPNDPLSSRSNDQGWELYGDSTIEGTQIGKHPVEWATGVYAMTEKIEASQAVVVGSNTTSGPYYQQLYSWGAFARARLELGRVFSVAGGARYNWERKDFEAAGMGFSRGSRNQRTWDALTGFAEIRADFTTDIGAFLKYTRGFKAGHFNPGRAEDAKVPGAGFADPEEINAFELGVNFAFLNGRLTGTTGAFYYLYDDYQVFRFTSTGFGLFRSLENARQARSYGVEFEMGLRPIEGVVPAAIEGLQIGFRGGYLEANFVEFTAAEDRFFAGGSIGVSIDFSGEPLINAPKYQFSATATWPIELGRIGTLTPQYDVTWTEDTPFDANSGRGERDVFGNSRLAHHVIGNRAFFLHHVRLSWEPPGDSRLKLSGWCRNVADQRYKTFSVDLSGFSGRILNRVADPRICGAETRFSW